jgi:hypothetical protein
MGNVNGQFTKFTLEPLPALAVRVLPLRFVTVSIHQTVDTKPKTKPPPDMP